MKSKRFVLNALLVVAILTLLVFSYSYVNQPRFGYALYAVFSGETTYNTYSTIGFIDALFFYVVGPVSSELIAFVVSYNLNQQISWPGRCGLRSSPPGNISAWYIPGLRQADRD